MFPCPVSATQRDDSRREDRGRDHDDDDYDYEERRERYREKDRDRWRSEDYYRDDRIEQGPVVMLRNLIDTVRKDDVSWEGASQKPRPWIN